MCVRNFQTLGIGLILRVLVCLFFFFVFLHCSLINRIGKGSGKMVWEELWEELCDSCETCETCLNLDRNLSTAVRLCEHGAMDLGD